MRGNPVFRRELLTGLRSPRLRLILALYLALPYLALAKLWPVGQDYFGGHHLGADVWHGFLFWQFIITALLLPIFAAYLVSEEFERGTADALWTTRIPPTQIIAGKLAAVILLSLALQVATLPALSLIFFLGGVSMPEVVQGYVKLLMASAFTCAVAVFFSARLKRGHAALMSTYLVVFVVLGAFGAARGIGGACCVLPVVIAILTLVTAGERSSLGNAFSEEMTRPNFKPIDDPKLLAERQQTWPYYLVDPLRRMPVMPDMAGGIAVVSAFERQAHPLLRTPWGIRCAYLMPALTIPPVLGTLRDTGYADLRPYVWWLNFMLAGGWVLLRHAISMTMDQEMGTMEGLRTTRIRPIEYLAGKWWSSLKSRWPMLFFGMVAVGLAQMPYTDEPWAKFTAPLGWVFAVEGAAWIALAMGSFSRSTMFAIAASVVATGVVLWALPTFNVWNPAMLAPVYEFVWQAAMWQGGDRMRMAWSVGLPFLVLGSLAVAAYVGVYLKWTRERE